MRCTISILLALLPVIAAAEDVRPQNLTETESAFQLGGAALRTEPLRNASHAASDVRRPTEHIGLMPAEATQQALPFGPAMVFVVEQNVTGQNAFGLGTYLERGAARAGIGLTYIEEDAFMAQSHIFFDYDLTKDLRLGMSGTLDASSVELKGTHQLGLNAIFTSGLGRQLQGEITSGSELGPIFGLSLGFRF